MNATFTALPVDLVALAESSAPAFWSAIAATCSAIAAITMVIIQRRNLLESVRPELILGGWTRREEGDGETWHEVIGFDSIRNVGRGAALEVTIFSELSTPVTSVGPPIYLPILPAGDTLRVEGHVLLWWQNVADVIDEQTKMLVIPVAVSSWDTRDMRHETVYRLLVLGGRPASVHAFAQPGEGGGGKTAILNFIAPGIILGQRRTTSTPGPQIRFQERMRASLTRLRIQIAAAIAWAKKILRTRRGTP